MLVPLTPFWLFFFTRSTQSLQNFKITVPSIICLRRSLSIKARRENEPSTSAEEQDMKTAARLARGKGRADFAAEAAEVEVGGVTSVKGKRGKGKRKSGDCSSGSPMSIASGSVTDRYLRALNTIE